MFKKLKSRGFQEPIHEDAPGFDSGKGHKNLIKELNEVVLPSVRMGIVGGADASVADYPLKYDPKAGQLYVKQGNEWVLVVSSQVRAYAPTHSKLYTVTVKDSVKAFAYLELTTDMVLSSGADIRAYQYGIERKLYYWRSNKDGSRETYNIVVECDLVAGSNEIELTYGMSMAPKSQVASQFVEGLGEFSLIYPPNSSSVGTYIAAVAHDAPNFLPNLKDHDDFDNHFQLLDSSVGDGGHYKVKQINYFYHGNGEMINPVVSTSGFTLNGVAFGDSSFLSYPAEGVLLERTNTDWMGLRLGIRGIDGGTLLCYEHTSFGRRYKERYYDYVAFMENGIVIFGEYGYENVESNYFKSDSGIQYKNNNGIKTYFPKYPYQIGTHLPSCYYLIPVVNSSFVGDEQPLEDNLVVGVSI